MPVAKAEFKAAPAKASSVRLTPAKRPAPADPVALPIKVLDVSAQDAANEEFFNREASKWNRPGNSGRPEPATLIHSCGDAKVWLGGLPRVEDLPWLERNNVTLLASAMDKTAAECRDGVRRGPLQMKCCVAHSSSERAEEWAQMKQIAVSTLAVGESVYVHCLAGVHRGPILAAALVGHVYSLDFDKVYDRIQQLRAIDKAGVMSRRGGGETFTWARRACNAAPDPVRLHLPVTWIASERRGALWRVSSSHLGVGGGGRVQPACQFKKGRQQNVFKGEVVVADSLTEALLHGRPFCTICRGMVPASDQIKFQ
eukprot:Skav227876  [mRNA]  locus=scaffold2896:234081:235019:+ [translate_table: standard]